MAAPARQDGDCAALWAAGFPDTRSPSFRFRLEPGMRYLVNPGSIGQPRDGNPLASFAMFDGGTRVVSVYRVPYRIERAQEKILGAGLPRPLADRLALGR